MQFYNTNCALRSEGWFLRNEGLQGVKMLDIMSAGIVQILRNNQLTNY